VTEMRAAPRSHTPPSHQLDEREVLHLAALRELVES
jgi:hypothetical protein